MQGQQLPLGNRWLEGSMDCASVQLEMFCLLIWVLVIWVCSLCNIYWTLLMISAIQSLLARFTFRYRVTLANLMPDTLEKRRVKPVYMERDILSSPPPPCARPLPISCSESPAAVSDEPTPEVTSEQRSLRQPVCHRGRRGRTQSLPPTEVASPVE